MSEDDFFKKPIFRGYGCAAKWNNVEVIMLNLLYGIHARKRN